MARYIFGGDTGMTPDEVRRQRELANLIRGKTPAPKNWGEGLNAIAGGLVGRWREDAANEAEAAGQASGAAARQSILDMITGGAGGYTPSAGAGGALAAANDMGGASASTPSGAPADGMDWLRYANQGATRNQPLSGELASALSFLPELGVEMEVFSGGQPAAGEGPRVGSTRHDHGNAADVHFYKDGQRLDWANPEHQPLFQEIVQRGRAAGITGFGAGEGYMRPGSMHLGFGDEAVWGAGGSGDNAPDWLRDANNSTQTALPSQAPLQVASLNGAGVDIPGVTSGQQAAPQYSPVQTAQAPQQAPQAAPMPMQQPQQVAQGPQYDIRALMEAASNPWLDEGTRSMVNAALAQELQRQDPAYQQGIEMNNLKLEQLRRQLGAPNLMEVGGQLYNPDTGDWIAPPTGPAAPQYEVIDGEVVWLDPSQQTATSGGQFGTPDPQGFSTVTLQLPDGTQRTLNTDDPAQAQAANQLLGQGAVEVSGSLVDINMPGEDAGAGAFWGKLGSAATDRYIGMMENGNNAARTLSQLDQLEGLLANSPSGFEAIATAAAGNFGIDLGNATGVQAAEALINQMVPSQRPPGSGPMSDADLELFKRSVPRLINQPGGNALIIQTMRDINNYDMQLARIVEDYAYRGQRAQTPEQADALRDEMRATIEALQNPMENFNDRIEGYRRPEGDAPAPSTTPGQSQANPGILNAPAVGTVQDGYRFKGGDPYLESNWELAQ